MPQQIEGDRLGWTQTVLTSSLKPKPIKLYGSLERLADSTGHCSLSQQQLAVEVGCGPGTIRDAVKTLIGAGFLCCRRRGLGHNNSYILPRASSFPKPVKEPR